MGKIHQHRNYIIRVQGNEHPPVHVHVIHPDGKAIVNIDGTVKNSGVPETVLNEATTWVANNLETINTEWQRMNNPPVR